MDAAHEHVVLDLDGRDRVLVEQLSEHDEPVLEKGVALRRRKVRSACYGGDAREPRPGTAQHFASRWLQCVVWLCGVLKRRGAGQR